jgi:carbon monoxide dehydrogenase subunit G
MARTIEVTIYLAASPDAVWAEVEQVERHSEWMADAESIEFLGDQQRGVGTRMKVATRVGPLRTMDIMEFTGWDPPHRMAIRHQGLVTGEGAFTLTPDGDGTRFTWREQLTFPWYLGGPITGFFAAPVLEWIWKRNLRGLAARFDGTR